MTSSKHRGRPTLAFAWPLVLLAGLALVWRIGVDGGADPASRADTSTETTAPPTTTPNPSPAGRSADPTTPSTPHPTPAPSSPHPWEGCRTDAITTRSMRELDSFADWLDEHGVRGVIGEAGWPGPAAYPDADRWAQLADTWLTEAGRRDVPVFAWSAAPWWSADESDSFYRGVDGAEDVTVADPQALLFERHLAGGLTGGVNLAEGTFGAPIHDGGTYANGNPGTLSETYTYPSAATLDFLSERGIGEARFAVMWERLQPELYGPLDATESSRIHQVFRNADRAGITLVLDVHNFGRYAAGDQYRRTVHRLGDPGLPGDALVDLWRRIATEFGDEPALAGYDLMNEPFELPGGARGWEQLSRDTAEAIRYVDRSTPLWVSGYNWSGAHAWTSEHPTPWMPTDAGPVIYQAHLYFDEDHSGRYAHSYERDNAEIAGQTGYCR